MIAVNVSAVATLSLANWWWGLVKIGELARHRRGPQFVD